MAWRAKVGRHVTVYTATGKPRTGRITAVTDQNNVTAKVYKGTPAAATRFFSVAASGARANKFRATA